MHHHFLLISCMFNFQINAAYMLLNPDVENLFSNVIEGITDVQLNNLQHSQLQVYDHIVCK